MNRTKTIAVFAGIFAIAMTTYGLSGVSASPMIMALVPSTAGELGMLGHVEHTVYDPNGIIKAYSQSDNVVVRTGQQCTGELLFGASGLTCANASLFDYIAIGNQTSTAAEDDIALAATTANTCATSGDNGEMARKQVTPTGVDSTGAGTVITLDVGTDTFKFDDFNKTTVFQSAIFNNDVTTAGTVEPGGGECVALGASGTEWEMFAIQDINVVVSNGDSLAVKWTVTIT